MSSTPVFTLATADAQVDNGNTSPSFVISVTPDTTVDVVIGQAQRLALGMNWPLEGAVSVAVDLFTELTGVDAVEQLSAQRDELEAAVEAAEEQVAEAAMAKAALEVELHDTDHLIAVVTGNDEDTEPEAGEPEPVAQDQEPAKPAPRKRASRKTSKPADQETGQ